MKKMMIRVLAPALCMALLLANCQRRTSTPSVNILSKDSQGLLTIAASGFGELQQTAEREARRSVLHRLIYDGIPDETVADARLPLVPNASQLSSAQRRAIDDVLAEPYSDRFFLSMNRDDTGAPRASNFKKTRGFVLRVNYDLLRKDLETRGVVRKFGL